MAELAEFGRSWKYYASKTKRMLLFQRKPIAHMSHYMKKDAKPYLLELTIVYQSY